MTNIKCNCGNKGCTVELGIDVKTNSLDLILAWKDKENYCDQSIGLNPNEVVQLISQLKQALQDMV